MERIFVQIASYRDPQLKPTVDDCIAKATHPERIFFGICNQKDDRDPWVSDEVFDGDNFRVINVPYMDSRGACWARRKVQELWQGEEYTLQLDSHHQFAEGWDEILIDMYKRCPAIKPIITGYVPQCPVDGNEKCTELYEMLPHFDMDNTILQFKPSIRKDTGLKQHMLWSGHFMFTKGDYCEDVPYDDDLYFIGEEVTMAVRSYTSGYDMFYPDKPVVWHEYGRAMRPKHWGDHDTESGIDTAFYTLDNKSKDKVKRMLLGESFDKCGLGSERSLFDYENSAGLCFSKSYVSTETIQFTEAPVFVDNSWRNIPYKKYTVSIDWSEHENDLKSFNPTQIAVFVRDERLDFKCDNGLVLTGEITAQWSSPPSMAFIWPYRCDPLVWGEKVPCNITSYEEEDVRG